MAQRKLRCALLGSFTLDLLPKIVQDGLSQDGIEIEWYVSPFNQYVQLIQSQESALFRLSPDVVFIAVAIEDLLYGLPAGWSRQEDTRLRLAMERIDDFVQLVRLASRRLPAATFLVHNFVCTEPEAHPLLSFKKPASSEVLAAHANAVLYTVAAELANVHVVDLVALSRSVGADRLCDARLLYLAKMRLSRVAIHQLGKQYERILRAYLGVRKKCIVVDLDDTLWGGVAAEDGIEHLLLSDDGPGKAFQDVQRVLLEYHRTGTLLAICSKNDSELALNVLREHPQMVLRPENFAAMRINWQDKATNLREIASELSLGLDSFVFVDDSAFERAQVQESLPEVTVVDLPEDSSVRPAFLARVPYFDSLSITDEDTRRGELYAHDRQRGELQRQAASLDEFLHMLEIRVIVRQPDKFTMPRLAQLTQKTNQFNLTTRRYTEGDLFRRLHDADWRLYVLETTDRIGASGIVGGAMVEFDRTTGSGRLDTFLLSCRVLGRGIERAFIAAIARDLRQFSVKELRAQYSSTKRNGVASDFLRDCGFVNEADYWVHSLDQVGQLCPPWIQIGLEVGEK